VELVVEDRDQSAASRALVDELGRSTALRLDVLEPLRRHRARARGERDAPAGLAIGAGFGEALAKGGDLPLVLARDPGKRSSSRSWPGT
jgi:hypothetical protein